MRLSIAQLILLALLPPFLAAQNPKLLKDIYPNTGNSNHSHFTSVEMLNGYAYFSADDGVSGRELWKTDGTTLNTILVKDLYAGSGEGSRIPFSNYVSLPPNQNSTGAFLLLSGNNGTTGNELFKTDGTSAGTLLLKNIMADSKKEILSSSPSDFITFGNTTLFTAGIESKVMRNAMVLGRTYKRELLRSDGTAAGTVLVKSLLKSTADYNPGTGEWGTIPKYMLPFNNAVYFYGYSSYVVLDSLSLCRSDGTAAGTWRVCAPVNFTMGNLAYNWYSLPCPADSNLYFVANDWTNGFELWKTDGSHAGTMMVKDINPNGASIPRHLIEMNGVLYFSADDGINGRELWRSDGTAQGTVMVADINPGTAGSNPCFITLLGSALYFTAAGESNTRQLWKSDGTQAGTILGATINPAGDCDLGTPYENPCYSKSRFAVAGGKICLRATDGVHGMELWESNGAAAGTRMLADIHPGPEGSMPRGVIEMFGKILFSADHPSWGSEPWVFDPAQSVSPKQIASIGGSSSTEPRILPLHPNPVSLSTSGAATTSVSVNLSRDCHARLTLSDLLGREIALVHEGTLRAGIHALNFNPGLLAPGVYVLHLQADGSRDSRALTVIR